MTEDYRIDALTEIDPGVVTALQDGIGATRVVARATQIGGSITTPADNSFVDWPLQGASWEQGATEVDQFLLLLNWQPLSLVDGTASIAVQLYVAADGGSPSPLAPDIANPTPLVFKMPNLDISIPRLLVPAIWSFAGVPLSSVLTASVSSNGGSVEQQVNQLEVFVLGTSSLGL